MNYEVKHDIENNLFKIDLEGKTAYLSYMVSGDTINFNSTYTPHDLRGEGLAKLLVEKGFDFAREKNLKVTSSCSYVVKCVNQNDDYKELMK
jgi:predicted GNAT family acetyltransferase